MSVNAQDLEAGTYYLYNVQAAKYVSAGAYWGTRSVLTKHGVDFNVTLNNGTYTLTTQIKGEKTALRPSDGYMDQSGTWTIASVGDGTYTILGSEGYYRYNETNIPVVDGAAKDAGIYWEFRSKAELTDAMSAATIENPVDATHFITAPDFVPYDYRITNSNAWTGLTNFNSGATTFAGNTGSGCTLINSTNAQSWNTTSFDINQTLTGLPQGTYKLQAYGFYRAGGYNDAATSRTNETEVINAILYAGDDVSTPLMSILDEAGKNGSVGENTSFGYVPNNQGQAADYFDKGFYADNVIYFYVGTSGSVKIGVKKDTKIDNDWTVFDNFDLQYYGDHTVAEVVLAEYVKAYKEALAAAQAYQNVDMFDTDKESLNSAISDNTLELTGSVTEEQLTQAANNLNAAATAATTAVARYNTYNTAVSLINNGTNINLTSLIGNPGFESSAAWVLVGDGWINEGVGIQGQNNGGFGANQVGNMFAERWDASKIGAFKTYQTMDALPAGIYEISVVASFNGSGASLLVNDATVAITDASTYKLLTKISDKGSITLGVQAIEPTGSWFLCDDFHMTYVGSEFPTYALVDGKMNADVAAAQTAADEAFKANETVDNYNTLLAAIAAAQASKDAYTAAGQAIANANALKEAHNLASATAYTTFAEAIAALETKYNDNTMTTDEGNGAGLSLGTVVTGWRAAANSAAVAYLNDGFSLNAFDAALYINTWSDEGENDGSNFKVPFYEYFAGDGSALGENTWTGQVTGLENGLYSVSAWVRVRSMNDATAVADLKGISMNVNGGTAVDVTEGDQVGESRFQLKEYTAEGLVKDGVLKVNFDIASKNNIHWLSFKNIKYTKVRELTDEEMAVAPTAIALYNGETEVTEPIALDATTNTVTLTPSYTPAEASEGYIDWTSSDESVATVVDGVVTAVSSGSATITATSTLDANVSGTATVNVSFPESTVPAFVNNGATRTVYNFGPNLIKNGSFEYSDNFYGWTSGTGEKLTSANFSIQTSGAYNGSNYLKASKDEGQAKAGSIYSSWPVESGKKYVFSYQMKNSSAVNNDGYIRTSLSVTTSEDESNYNDMFGAVSCGTDWTNISYEFTVPEGKNYLVFSARWLKSSKSFDNFYLCEVLADPTTEGNVDYAIDAIPTANIGTGAFQYSQDAIGAANALVQGEATVEDVEDVYTALTTLNAPADDQAFNIVMGELTWTNNDNATMLSTVGKAVTYYAGGRNDAGGYTAQFDKAPNTNLAQAFYFTAADGINKYTIYQYDVDGNKRYLCTGTVYSGNANQVRTTTDAASAEVYTITATATEGVYNFTNSSNINLGAQDAGLYGTTRNNNLLIVETSKPSIAINTTAAGWGTTILPFAASIPTDVKVYSCAEVDGNKLTLVEVTALEANKPYIIEGSWDETLTGDALGTKLEYTEGLLTGVYTQRDATVDTYVMQKLNDKVGFYKVTEVEGKVPTIKANRCYMTAPAAGEARAAYFFTDDVTTGINAVEALTSGDAQIFNAAGAQLPKLQKGMNIIRKADGTSYKVMVK